MKNLGSERSSDEARPIRARAILEFPAGDTSRTPIIYTTAGSAEQDEALRNEILKRWSAGA